MLENCFENRNKHPSPTYQNAPCLEWCPQILARVTCWDITLRSKEPRRVETQVSGRSLAYHMHKVLILLPRNLGRGDRREEGRREVGGWDGWTDLSWQKADSMPLQTDHHSWPAKPISPPIPHSVTCKTKYAVDLGSHHQFWSSEKWGLWKVNQISGSSLGV